MKSSLRLAVIAALAASLPLALAAPQDDAKPHKQAKAGKKQPLAHVTQLIAVVQPLNGSNVQGSVLFNQTDEGVEVVARIGGLNPDSEHGFHIHEFGNAIEGDGSSAGGHYNPDGHAHGMPDSEQRHAGDLGNLQADADGNAEKTMTIRNVTLTGRKNPIIGRAVIVHAKPDDGSQPTGDAGDRIGIGVIGISVIDAPDDEPAAAEKKADQEEADAGEAVEEAAEPEADAAEEGPEE